MQDSTVIQLSFSDSEIPEFKQVYGEKYVRFGKENKYPDYLLELYNKSAKHNAIINGKVNYIFGGGFELDVEDPKAEEFKKKLSKIDKQSLTDIEVFGGFYWEIIPSMYDCVSGIYHLAYKSVRTNKDRSIFYYKKDWNDMSEKVQTYPAFNRNLKVKSIFSFREYRPGDGVYPLPGYVASCNYIEADVEVSRHTLTNAKTGFSGSKFINFYNGEPTPEGKKEVSDKFKTKFSGSEGEKIVIAFNKPGTQAPTIEDLGTSDLTKEDFSQVDNLITNNIFSGAQITHPLLFGIQQEGKLGGATELRTAFDIFKNTYVTSKQQQFEEVVNFFASLKGITATYKLKDIDPIGVEITTDLIRESLSKEEIRERLGYTNDQKVNVNAIVTAAINSLSPLVANKVLESMTADEIRSLAGLQPKPGGNQIVGLDPSKAIVEKTPEQLASEPTVNSTLRDLTAKQHQQLTRIIRQYGKGQLDKAAATVLLKSGLGMNDAQIAEILGLDQEQAFSSAEDMELLFQAHGEPKEGYEAVKSKAATFDAQDDEFIMSYTFDKAENAAEETSLKPPAAAKTPPVKVKLPEFKIMYSYEVREGEGPELLPTSRSFCVKMVAFSKFYTRSDIQKISGLLGYNVFDRVGGFWNDNGVIKKHCRHEWRASIVVKK